MAINSGEAQMDVRDINQSTREVLLPNPNLARGFGEERRLVERDLAEAYNRVERNPEAARDVLDQMDGDALLMRDVVLSRRGWRGRWNRLVERTNLRLGNIHNRLSNSGNATARLLGTAAVGTAIGIGVRKGLHLAGGPAGAVAGAASGGFWGWMRGRERVESAGTWMTQLGIEGRTHAQLEGLGEGEIEWALGLMREAIKAGKVRGQASEKLQMALKYRELRDILVERRNAAVASGETLDETHNPVLFRVNQALSGAEDDFHLISEMAGKEYEPQFSQIEKMKKDQVKMAAIKGAVVGGTIGGIVGFIIQHGGFEKSWEALKQYLHIPSSAGDATADLIRAQKAHLLGSAAATTETHQHLADVDLYNHYMSDGSPDWSTMTPDQQAMIGHINHLNVMGSSLTHPIDASSLGFHPGDLHNFATTLQASTEASHHDLWQLATNHNINLDYNLPSGEHFGDFLMNHKDAFIHFPPDIQQFILSHPSIASDVFNLASTGSTSAIASIVSKIGTATALVGAGVGFGLAHRNANRLEGQVGRAFSEPRAEIRRADAEQLRTRQQEARQNSINRLWAEGVGGNRIRLLIPGLVNPARGSDLYDISGVDPDGRVRFADNEWDTRERAAGRDPHPVVNVNDLVDADGRFNTTNVLLQFETPAEGQAQRGREEAQRVEREANLEAVRARLVGATVEFTPAFLADPARAYAPLTTRLDRRFRITNITADPEGRLLFAYTDAEDAALRRTPGAAINLPTVSLRDLVDVNNRLREPNPINVIRAVEAGPEPAPPPEEFDPERFRDLVGREVRGTLTRAGREARYRIDPASITPAAVRTRVMASLGGNPEVVVGTIPPIDNYPPRMTISARFRNVSAGEANQPLFEIEPFVEVGTESYTLDSHFGASPAGPALAAKRAFIGRLTRIATDPTISANSILYFPSHLGFYRATAYNPAGAGTFTLTNTSGVGTLPLTRAEMGDDEDIYYFIRR